MTVKDYSLEVSLPDEGRLLALKTILGYEAGVRGLTIGQAFVQLLEEAVDLDSYPEEVRERINEIHERARHRAVSRSLDAALPRSA